MTTIRCPVTGTTESGKGGKWKSKVGSSTSDLGGTVGEVLGMPTCDRDWLLNRMGSRHGR